MSDTADQLEQPQIGQSVAIARGPLEGIIGILSARRGKQWVIELLDCGAGVLLVVDPVDCEPVT